jgi:hypothetical protein
MLGSRKTLLGLIALLAGGPALAAGDIALFLGQRQFEDEEILHIEDAPQIGMFLTHGKPDAPVALAVDLLIAQNDETIGEQRFETTTVELDGGVRKIWLKRVRPFVGGGIALIKFMSEAGIVTTDTFGTDSDDFGAGLWVDGGVLWNVGENFRLGLDVRYSWADVKIFHEDLNGGGTQVGLLIGWGL